MTKRALVLQRIQPLRRPRRVVPPPSVVPPPLRLRHYKHVYWMTDAGPLTAAYRAVVVHDGCKGCAVCDGTTDWFMEFARIARGLVGINLRDCLHWGPLHDNPRPLIAPASNLGVCNRVTLERLRKAYYRKPPLERPSLGTVPTPIRELPQEERFEWSVDALARMVELWEDGQYIGWPS